MKFRLTTSSLFEGYTNDPLGYLLGVGNKPAKYAERIESMKKEDESWEHTIEINSIEELLDFRVKCDCDIIVGYYYDTPSLEIYDTWRE